VRRGLGGRGEVLKDEDGVVAVCGGGADEERAKAEGSRARAKGSELKIRCSNAD
jgi:hypothetical protein